MRDEVKKNSFSFIPHPSSLIPKFRRMLRGEVGVRSIAFESWRRSRLVLHQKHERAHLDQLGKRGVSLGKQFVRLSASNLLHHFRQRTSPRFLPGFDDPIEITAELQKSLFPVETAQLIEFATRMTQKHRWPLLGYGEIDFGETIEWRRDIVSNDLWPLDYHADVDLTREGSDVRVLWELNRLGHLVALGRAYAVTNDERLAAEFFAQIESWQIQNPVGRGPNWACAMEVALRAMNLLAAFQLFRRSPSLNEDRLMRLLAMFEQHGAHIRRNLEFSYLVTSNHYLSDIVGLFWLGTMLPELRDARHWRDFGRRELLREMDAQILADGADFEASTGYHRFVLELFLYTLILFRVNELDIPERYLNKLYSMLMYVREYLRPDGRAPLVGDTDSGQVLPIVKRDADDHAYVLEVGASFLKEPRFKLSEGGALTEELLWVFGSEGVLEYQSMPRNNEALKSNSFADAGTYIMRDDDLYLLFNASGSGVNGRGSHGHNDVLSLEVSACGTSFIVDPGTYVYRTDLHERHLFRSTAYHSTVEIDGVEQNTIDQATPFVIGNEARPQVLKWESIAERDVITAEHHGYMRLDRPVKHRRSVEFDKPNRVWLIEDELIGEGEHVFNFRFHLAHGLDANLKSDGIVEVLDKLNGARLFIVPLDPMQPPEFEPRWTSRDYGTKMASVSVCWSLNAIAPIIRRWVFLPLFKDEVEIDRLKIIEEFRANRKSLFTS